MIATHAPQTASPTWLHQLTSLWMSHPPPDDRSETLVRQRERCTCVEPEQQHRQMAHRVCVVWSC